MNFRFVLTKVFRALLTLWIVVTFAFVIMHASGDPIEIMLGDQAEQDVIDHYKALYGLDRPMHEQYYRYVVGILQGDLGYSLSDQRPVTELLVEAIPATLELGLTALVVSLLVGIPLGIIAALNRNKPIDRFVMTFAVLGFSIPNFFLGILLILLFSMTLRWLPTAGMGGWEHLVMPALTLGTAAAGSLARFTRSSMLEVLNKLYMRTAVAKGVPRGRRIRWHALPNAAIPLVTVLGFRLGRSGGRLDRYRNRVRVAGRGARAGVGRDIARSGGRAGCAAHDGMHDGGRQPVGGPHVWLDRPAYPRVEDEPVGSLSGVEHRRSRNWPCRAEGGAEPGHAICAQVPAARTGGRVRHRLFADRLGGCRSRRTVPLHDSGPRESSAATDVPRRRIAAVSARYRRTRPRHSVAPDLCDALQRHRGDPRYVDRGPCSGRCSVSSRRTSAAGWKKA
jgi:peptide/nickel transport system permease protein